MGDVTKIGVVHRAELASADILDVLRRFTEMAKRGELLEVMVVAIDATDHRLVLGASGNVRPTEQVGMLERFKATIIDIAEGR
jgi:hypothetical protein